MRTATKLTVEHGPRPVRHEMMLQTSTQQRNTAARYRKLGYAYIVGWKDVAGFGLIAVKNAVGIAAGESYVSLN